MNDRKLVSLRLATIDDLELLEYWDTQPHVIESDYEEENWAYELQRNPEWRDQFIAELDGRPLGCLQIIDPAEDESHYWGNVAKNLRAIDIWIGEKADLRKGYGTQMMKLALNHYFENEKVTAVIIDPLESNNGAISFYKHLGFAYVEKKTFGKSDCVVLKLTQAIWAINLKFN